MIEPILAKIKDNINHYLLVLVSLTTFIGAIVYYLYALNWLGVIGSLILIAAAFTWILKSETIKKIEISRSILNKKNSVLLAGYGLIYLILWLLLWQGQSDRALISPWSVINPNFFWLYALATLSLILLLIKKDLSARLKIVLISLHYLVSLSVALIIYKIGYGFDPFIHQATMELIAEKGLVLPKPPYYLGQYGLIVIIHKISGLSIYLLNKILLTALTALFLPTAVYNFLGVTNQKRNNEEGEITASSFLTILFLLLLTFSPFTLTTPQNLSYLFLILTVLSGFNRSNLRLTILLALTTTAIHPLTGLPALGWVAWLLFKKSTLHFKPTGKKLIRSAIWLFTALVPPLALFLSGGNGFKIADGNWSSFLEPIRFLIGNPGTAGQENWLLNGTYFLAANYNLILIIAAAVALFYFYRLKKTRSVEEQTSADGLVFINSGLLIAYLLSSLIYFNNLINYEQAGYASRIPIIMLIFWLPFIIISLQRLLTAIRETKRLEQVLWLIFGVSFLTASLYLSYPRFDKYWNSRGYSTSANDLEAVRMIAREAESPYLVLANQQVSAAALQEFGFDHYYLTATGLLYFYPIPTGGPLYQHYLNMVYKNPSQQEMTEALNLTGINLGYLIVNKYWYQSSRIIGVAKLTADKWWTVNNEVYIFKYHR